LSEPRVSVSILKILQRLRPSEETLFLVLAVFGGALVGLAVVGYHSLLEWMFKLTVGRYIERQRLATARSRNLRGRPENLRTRPDARSSPAASRARSQRNAIGHARLQAHEPKLAWRKGTPIAVQQKLMRHSDIRTMMNIYGDVVTDEMGLAHLEGGGAGALRRAA
jgi:nitrate reductase NapE component